MEIHRFEFWFFFFFLFFAVRKPAQSFDERVSVRSQPRAMPSASVRNCMERWSICNDERQLIVTTVICAL